MIYIIEIYFIFIFVIIELYLLKNKKLQGRRKLMKKFQKISLVLSSVLLLPQISLATPLDEAIKDVDVSGFFRYRYDSASGNFWHKRGFQNGAGILSRQEHNWRAILGFDAAIADNFRAFIQFGYSAADAGFGGDPMATGEAPQGADTTSQFNVREFFLTYTATALNTDIIAGKQQVDSIWTDNSFDGLIGTGIKVVNTSIEGLSLLAFAFDNFNTANNGDEGDIYNGGVWGNTASGEAISPFNENLYGAAALGNYEINHISLTPQLWLSYLDDSALFYAFTLGISTHFFEDVQWSLAAAYLGNSVDNKLKKYVDFSNNNFFGLSSTIDFSGFDASLGGLYYGDKNHYTLTTLEDLGNLGDFIAGEEIWYSDGSKFYGDLGENAFGFIKAGYTFNEVLRIGADFVYGGTKVGNVNFANKEPGEKFEAVARISYQYSPKLSFEAFYSYLNIDAKQEEAHKNSTRLQVLYQF